MVRPCARERIDVVNLTNVHLAGQLHHGTFAESLQVVELIGRSIASGQTFTGRAGLRERIMATTVGAAVGNAASLATSIGQFLKDQGAILGSIAAIVSIAGGIWKLAAFFAKKSEQDSSVPSVEADHGGVAAGRDITGPVNTNTHDDSKG